MPLFLGCQCWYSFNDKTPFPDAKTTLTPCAHANLFFFFLNLKDYIPYLSNVLHSDKI